MQIDKLQNLARPGPETRSGYPYMPPPSKRVGVLSIRNVRMTAFIVITVTLFICTVLCLFAVWDLAARDTAWRAFASLGIIIAAMMTFVFVNETFGQALAELPAEQPVQSSSESYESNEVGFNEEQVTDQNIDQDEAPRD